MIWSLLSFISSVIAVTSTHASIYKFPEHAHEFMTAPPILTPAEGRQVWAEILQVSRYHKLGFIGQQARVMDIIHEHDDPLSIWDDTEGSVVLSIAGVVDAHHIFPKKYPLYTVEDSPREQAYNDLLVRLLHQAEELRGERLERVYGNSKGGGLYLSPPLKVSFESYSYATSHIYKHIHELVRHGPSSHQFESRYGKEAASIFDMKVTEDRHFMKEISALESFVDALSKADLDSQFAAGHLVSLETLYHKYGAHSKKYVTAIKVMRTCLKSLPSKLQSQKLYLTLLPIGSAAMSPLNKRALENAGAFGGEHSAPTLESSKSRSANSMCFDSQSQCEKATNKCSGHGSCGKYMGQDNCYVCQCVPTVTNGTEGRKTTEWAGPTCAKKDVSVPFNIFFWFFVAMVATLVWCVKLMYSIEIGSGVLAATGHIKQGAPQ